MVKLNLGCGRTLQGGWINIDKCPTPGAMQHDLEDGLPFLLDGSVDEVWAHHVLEHMADLDRTMRELHRVCAAGATIDIVVPLANTLWAVANPDHKRLFNHRTFSYYSRDFETSDLGLFRGFDIVSQVVEREPDEWFQGIPWIVANLHVVLRVVK